MSIKLYELFYWNCFSNFTRFFSKLLFDVVDRISQVLLNRFIWNLVWIFFIYLSIASALGFKKFENVKKGDFFLIFHVDAILWIFIFGLGQRDSDIFTDYEFINFFVFDHYKGWNHVNQSTQFFFCSPTSPACTLSNLSFLFLNFFFYILETSINIILKNGL